MSKKKILYIDMDNVLVDFQSGIDQLDDNTKKVYVGDYDEVPGIFGKMKPMIDAVESFVELSKIFDTYILSTAPWENHTAWSDKLNWVKQHLGQSAYKRLILTHHKNLNAGDFLVNDRNKNGANRFGGELIIFGKDKFPDWMSVKEYLITLK
jgi:5'-nucleotidase